MGTDLFLGVDGGGTRCRVRIRTRDAALVGEAVGGSANIFTDPVAARATIIETVAAALAAGGLGPERMADCSAGLGLAGANLAEVAARFDPSTLPFRRTVLRSDAIAACLGAHGGGDGGIAILGTGSAYVARAQGRDVIFGGWGFVVSDVGSGADIGRAALSAALLAADELAPTSPLLAAVLKAFEDSPAAIARFSGGARPVDFGRFAPMVWDAADAGDPVALDILAPRIAVVETALRRLLSLGAPALCLLGGQAERYAARIGKGLQPSLRAPRADALEGALMLVLRGSHAQ
ncbi:BadF/BadG/BcrA/BcrD ATPase family protein [Aureimonas frigidaquae]|uniref:N-acetylglucosamine kinase n=1 Tax=Aureimonas frigidaquae TaxID=424757 RepID=A0A0P0Z2H0_9HYPH|nr:BadF/BadG/BcrA/BcrD ATPase family protein [Aureimonas frigidaquae]BAT28104.1 N-acetylglucosamine kinase [Aureimonas frigidaquae]